MKCIHRSKRQQGFFDLGMSVLVFALAGGLIYGAETERTEQLAAEQQSVAAIQGSQQTPAAVSVGDKTVIAEAVQSR